MSGEPFGKPFDYTETIEFTSEKRPWYKRLLGRKKRLPLAWIINEDADCRGQAYVMLDDREACYAQMAATVIDPIYDERVLSGALEMSESLEQEI